MVKRFISLLLTFAIFFSVAGCKGNQVANIYDNNSNVVVSVADINSFSGHEAAYLDIVIAEACEIISQLVDCDTATAKKNLQDYSIYTYLDVNLTSAVATSYSETINGANFGCAITSLNGKLISAYSISADPTQNFASTKTQQHSAMKPLSVYAPAVESELVNWSTLTADSPYKKITEENGSQFDWPANATGTYTNENTTIYQAIQQSLNTVAVKVLSQYGVNNSMDFLQKNLGVDVQFEQYKATIYGEDEVIGNIALGATQAGSSPVDMAGYYQIFANGGYYTTPTAIKQITDKKGNIIYKDNATATQVISSQTSYIMNELLQGVVSPGGTGTDAYTEGIQIAGKTGTGDAFTDNWFVGVTPEYSCAVWHSSYNNTNLSPKVFSKIASSANIQNTLFMTSPDVKKYIYCPDSGLLLGTSCKRAEMGFFSKDNPPQECTMH